MSGPPGLPGAGGPPAPPGPGAPPRPPGLGGSPAPPGPGGLPSPPRPDDADEDDDWDDEDDWDEDDEDGDGQSDGDDEDEDGQSDGDDEDDAWDAWDDEDEEEDGEDGEDGGEPPVVPVPLARPEDALARDAALIAPLPSPDPEDEEDDWDDEEPEAVLPQAPQPRTTRQDHRTVRRNAIQPGHLICGECGQGNPPNRRFCSRCGSELSEAEVARAPWWHRLRPRRGPRVVALGTGSGRTPESAAPGERRRRVFNAIKIIAGVVVLVGSVLYASYPPYRHAVGRKIASVRSSVKAFTESHYSPVRPSKAVAKSFVKGDGPDNSIDLNTATYWAAPAKKDDEGKMVLTVEFDKIVSLNQLIITPGVADGFTEHGRPNAITVKYTNDRMDFFRLQDSEKPQKFTLTGATGIKTVQITVNEVFPGQKHDDVAISELEFFSLLS
ncbi:NADase-type glycan-binding domain-containing protein [Streptomyces griseofuscus]|uniref:NADase-type glycan-binding domain-containing protein n=1 Tax=Streptomyces griseofuscus TaxID=146922 RepID=UPI003451211E